MSSQVTLELPTPQATTALGHTLAARLFPGAVLALIGQLGAGKTHLTAALAEGLGIAHGVTSPTFVLQQEYHGRLIVHHFDVYRLPSSQSFADLGVHEYLEGEDVCIIEWADRVQDQLPADRLEILLETTGETSRRATLTATGPRHQILLTPLCLPT
ncbi:MAG: tRNA (adenosine(37)-N6)-threonylcarbamoyltransferase complex ATPase subunit type 1 TsaE [Gemmataceae bacterium]